MPENKQFIDQELINDIRKELDTKIDEKTSDKTFKWIIGGMAALFLTSASLLWNAFSSLNNKIETNAFLSDKEVDKLRDRITVLETKLNEVSPKVKCHP